jgi:hypothetical protein
MELKNLISSTKIIEVEHPEFEGFKVKLQYIPKDKLRKIADRATTQKFSKKTHQPEESIDNEKFLSMYVEELIRDWTGLKYKYLPELLPIDLEMVEDEGVELEFSLDNAITLMKNSTNFDSWISSIVGDITNFNKRN